MSFHNRKIFQQIRFRSATQFVPYLFSFPNFPFPGSESLELELMRFLKNQSFQRIIESPFVVKRDES